VLAQAKVGCGPHFLPSCHAPVDAGAGRLLVNIVARVLALDAELPQPAARAAAGEEGGGVEARVPVLDAELPSGAAGAAAIAFGGVGR